MCELFVCVFTSNQTSVPHVLRKSRPHFPLPVSEADVEVQRRQQVHGQREEQREFTSTSASAAPSAFLTVLTLPLCSRTSATTT